MFKDGKDGALAAKNVEDAKVSQTGLHLEYLFDMGVNFISRTIVLTDDVEHPMFHIIDAAMSEMERINRKAITVKINSYGGEVIEALAVVARMRNSPCQIITECYGTAQSAATLILAAGDKRRMSKYAYAMHHCGAYSIRGRHPNNKAEIAQNEQMEKDWAKWLAEFTKKDTSYWYHEGLHVDTYFTPDECLEVGLVDEVF